MIHKINPALAGATTLLLSASLTWAGEPPPTAPAFSETAYRPTSSASRRTSSKDARRAPRARRRRSPTSSSSSAPPVSQPGIGDSFLQPVPVVEITTHPDDTMPIRGAKGSTALRYGDDMVVWTRQPVAESRVEDAELVFAGYGIVAPEYGWNDYAGLDMRGKIAVVLVNDPGFATQDPKLFTGNAMTYYGRWTYKYEEAVAPGRRGPVRRPRNQARRIPVGSRPQRLRLADRPAHRRLRDATPRARGVDDAGGRAARARVGRRGLRATQAGCVGPEVPSAAARGQGERRRA